MESNGNLFITHEKQIFALQIQNEKGILRKLYDVKSKVLSVLDLNEKYFLVGTNTGLQIIKKSNKTSEFITEDNGLPNNTIYGILAGESEKVWLSTNQGLINYNLNNEEIKILYKEDGLQGNEFNSGAFHQSKDGLLWFGGMNGINYFSNKDLNFSDDLLEIGITQINIFDKKMEQDSNVNCIQKIELNHDENTFSIDFTALNFSHALYNKYQYKLEKADTNWVNADEKHFVRYAQMKPSNYHFLIRAKNGNGIWGATKKIQIIIHPPFWKKWWFILSTSLIGLAFLIIIISFLSQRTLKQKLYAIQMREQLQNEKSRIARELHDNVGSQLTYIIMNMESIDNQIEKEESLALKKLKNLKGFARDTMQELREAIWTINSETISCMELKERMQIFLQRHLANNEKLVWNFEWNDDLDIIILPSQSLNLIRVIQEATNNMLKYSMATKFNINVKYLSDSFLDIYIIDNGIGFDKTNISSGFGLNNMTYRINEIGGKIDIESSENKGTKIHIVVPISK